MRASQLSVLLALVALWGLVFVQANDKNHRYAPGDSVKVWVNKVGPYNNPQETYNYYHLPFCKKNPDAKPEHRWGGLGQVLEGNELINSQLEIKFGENKEKTSICSQKLSQKEAKALTRAVRGSYWSEWFIDDLPVWGFVGEHSRHDGKQKNVLYTHKSLDIAYNGDRIIQVNLTSDNPVPIDADAELEFTYSVTWSTTTIPFARRFERYLDANFFQHKIHWFSIFNSFMMVLFLTGLVAVILMRTLRKDYARYARDEDDLESLERDLSEESGWKLVHGDVFRPPRRLMLLCALVGTGAQIAFMTFFVVLITIASHLFEERGTIVTVSIMCYALSSVYGGYVSGSMYSRNEGRQWIACMLLTATALPGTCFTIAFVLNMIAVFYQSLAAVPFGSIVALLLIWGFISFPLCLFGTVLGRNWTTAPNNPCRVKRIPSPIPYKRWVLQPLYVALIGGLLPFGSIFIEMYFIFTSFWNYKVYFVYGFMLLVLFILLTVTTCTTVVGTYFLLNAENYHWHWTAFGSGLSTGLYVFLYAIHYFVFKTKMTGFFQTAYYFGYSAMFCFALGLMAGGVGYLGAKAFVHRIYRNIKCD